MSHRLGDLPERWPGSGSLKRATLPETNIAPENGGFQQESPFPGVYSGAMLVSGRVGLPKKTHDGCLQGPKFPPFS